MSIISNSISCKVQTCEGTCVNSVLVMFHVVSFNLLVQMCCPLVFCGVFGVVHHLTHPSNHLQNPQVVSFLLLLVVFIENRGWLFHHILDCLDSFGCFDVEMILNVGLS